MPAQVYSAPTLRISSAPHYQYILFPMKRQGESACVCIEVLFVIHDTV